MTNKEIHKLAFERLRRNADTTVITALYIIMIPVFVLLIESLIYIIADLLGLNYHIFRIDYYAHSSARVWFLLLRLCIHFVVITSQMYVVRRYFISMDPENRSVIQYISNHIQKILLPSVKCSLQLIGLKLLVLSPVSVGLYGIYHFGLKSRMNEITLFGLVCFMLSVGFTIVWTGVSVHYFMSLSMVKYINQLNPRANFFDACDLSIKLMEGKHYRLTTFYASLLIYLPLVLLVYPLLALIPFFIESKLIFAQQIMGKYWQDKLPAMARRWEKQQIRQGKA